MKIRTIFIVLILIISINYIYSQNEELSPGQDKIQTTAAFYDISDPIGINIEVNLWGFVKYPGRYKIPYNSTILDLLSFSGGPVENSDLHEIRILRTGNDSLNIKSRIIKIDYNDLLWGEKINQNINNPVLQAGDVVLVKQEKRYSFRENLLLVLPIVSSIVAIATLIITLTRK